MKIIKIDANGKEHNFGGGFKDPYECIPKNYKLDETGLFYGKKGTKCVYIVDKEERDK